MNAMAHAPGLGIRDFFGGAEDARQGIIRAVGDPETRFREDAPADSAGRSLCLCAGLFPGEGHGGRRPPVRPGPGGVSAERLYAELGKLLCGKAAGRVYGNIPRFCRW